MTMSGSFADHLAAGRRGRVLVRIFVGLLLLVAGAVKVVRPESFHASLLSYELGGPEVLYRWVAALFPWLEVVCGGLLIAGRWCETAGAMAVVMTLVFVLILGQGMVRGLNLECGCFAGLMPRWVEQPPVAFARALAMLVASVWVWLPAASVRSTPLGSPNSKQ